MSPEEREIRHLRHDQIATRNVLEGVRDDIRGVSLRALVSFTLSGFLGSLFGCLMALMVWEAIR